MCGAAGYRSHKTASSGGAGSGSGSGAASSSDWADHKIHEFKSLTPPLPVLAPSISRSSTPSADDFAAGGSGGVPAPPVMGRHPSQMSEEELSSHATRLQRALRSALDRKKRIQQRRLREQHAIATSASPPPPAGAAVNSTPTKPAPVSVPAPYTPAPVLLPDPTPASPPSGVAAGMAAATTALSGRVGSSLLPSIRESLSAVLSSVVVASPSATTSGAGGTGSGGAKASPSPAVPVQPLPQTKPQLEHKQSLTATLVRSVRNPGNNHLYIVRSDIRRLACDAWLLPSGSIVSIPFYWLYPPSKERPKVQSVAGPRVPDVFRRVIDVAAAPQKWCHDDRRVGEITNYASDRGRAYPTSAIGTMADVLDGVIKFISYVEYRYRNLPPRFGRQRHLFALPVVGTGYGGLRGNTGFVVQELLKFLKLILRYDEYCFDVCLVCYDLPTYLLAQQSRYALFQENWVSGMPQQLIEQAHQLAIDACRENLCLFLGDHALDGFPGSVEQLTRIGREKLGLSEKELATLLQVSRYDAFKLLSDRMGSEAALVSAVSAMMRTDELSLTNTLCAAIPTSEVITINQDDNFESASDVIGERVCVLPDALEQLKVRQRWALKLNGCVTRPDSLVLTRQQFLKAAPHRHVNRAIVEAELVTKHMLLIDVPVSDPHFQEFVNSLHHVVRSTSPNRNWSTDPIATVLIGDDPQLLQQMWPQLRIISPSLWIGGPASGVVGSDNMKLGSSRQYVLFSVCVRVFVM